MELRCPHCQNALTIDDQYAGQLMRCPTCNGTFQAPTLAPANNQSWVAPPPPEPLPSEPEPPPTEPVPQSERPKKKKERPTPAPIVEGDYTKTHTLTLSGRILPWIAPIGFFLIVLLSFFPWVSLPGANIVPGLPGAPASPAEAQRNLWQLALSQPPKGVFTVFVVLSIFLAWPLSIVSLLISLRLIPLPSPLDTIASFRSIIVGALALAGFIFFLIGYIEFLFADFNPSTLAMKIAFRIALVVAVTALMQFWLDRRRIRNLPPPQLTIRY